MQAVVKKVVYSFLYRLGPRQVGREVFHIVLRRCETPPSPPTKDPVSIENCKQLFSQLLSFTTQKIATHCIVRTLSPLRVAHRLKAMCHTDVVSPIVTNRFPYFRRTSSFIDSKQGGLL